MTFKIHREGFPFIALFAGVNLLAFLMSPVLGLVVLPLTIWCVALFRDPDRQTPTGPGLIMIVEGRRGGGGPRPSPLLPAAPEPPAPPVPAAS